MSTIGVFIDLRKAFDTSSHRILDKKLEHYGIRVIASKWIISYLTSRKQYVDIQNTSSNINKYPVVFFKGQFLGENDLLFILMKYTISPTLKFTLFADDTNIFYSGSNINNMCKGISRELYIVNEWFCVNKLP